MVKNILNLAIVGLVLYVVYLIVAMVISGMLLQVVGVILLIVFLLRALETFGINL